MELIPTVELLERQLNDVEQRYAPSELWVRGEPSLLAPSNVRVSLVGSRKASAEGLRRCRKLSRLLVEEGVVVVSGLAQGIDTAAHSAAIESGGRTVAVVGTGIDRAYPSANRRLQEEIATDHLLVSQFPPGAPPNKRHFPQRNRTMALISDATVIIEAGETSGSLHQGWEALRLARPLFVLRSVLESDRGWPEKMIGYGARVLDDVGEVLDWVPSPVAQPAALAI